MDHPRSRGVYQVERLGPAGRQGSSPLARGLRSDAGTSFKTMRIIPARAGFTSAARSMGRPEPDHPRSRGVYVTCLQQGGTARGSSPLARGLRDDRTGARPEAGDHPRSRGVYRSSQAAMRWVGGSSPLARGLRRFTTVWGASRGIIPARAGVTHDTAARHRGHQDHPRSRGVYTYVDTLEGPMIGSSPLARGLLPATTGTSISTGIIPARAGFTLG